MASLHKSCEQTSFTQEICILAIKKAIQQLANPKGSSLEDVQKYMNSKLHMGMIDEKNLKLSLKEAVKTGVISNFGGKYKVKEVAKQRKYDKMDTLDEPCEHGNFTPEMFIHAITTALRQLECPNGSSLEDKQKYLNSKLYKDMTDETNLKLHLKEAIKTGVVSKFGGKCKVNEVAKARSYNKMDSMKKPFQQSNLTPEMYKHAIATALRQLKNPNGSSLEDIQKYVCSNLHMDMADEKNLNFYLKEAVKTGVVSDLCGKYKIQEVEKSKYKKRDSLEKVCHQDNITSEMYIYAVTKAIRQLADPSGSSLEDIKKYVGSKLNLYMSENNLKLYLKEAIDMGEVLNMGGKYKIKRVARSNRNPSKGRKRGRSSEEQSSSRKMSESKKSPDIRRKL